MADAKFTPGPWTWDKPVHWPDHNINEGWLGGFYAGDVCVMNFGNNTAYYPSEGEPPKEADAYLIKAAPGLYEALEEILQVHGEAGPVSAKARAVLAEARGEK